jgi:hypothetical protein
MHPMLSVLILDAHRANLERSRSSRPASPFAALPRLRDRTRTRG